MADINATLEYIHSVKWQGSKPGLGRTRELLRALGNPEKKLKFVHVAGTNGKGSTCACIASVLKQAGYKTGLYTSPYVMQFNERMQINGEMIADEDLIRLTEQIKPHAEAMRDLPTEFELITALGMQYFFENRCDIVVLEVGMGGELDSTNVIGTPELAVITAIDYDHVQQLGPTLRDIARAKAGIIKSGGDVLFYGGDHDVEQVIAETVRRQGGKLYKTDFSRIKEIEFASECTKMTVEPYGEMALPLAGTYQPNNALTAVTALEILRSKGYAISDGNIRAGLATVRWAGRFDILGREPVFILDGAHNLHGVKAAAESLTAYYGNRRFIFIVGVMADKDVAAMTAAVAPLAAQVYTVAPNIPRAMGARELADVFSKQGVSARACQTIGEGVRLALEKARKCGDAVICALGSLYMSGDVRSAYQEYRSTKNT